jgi:flagellar biosynthesis/type III secretory pathway M-ring protein FliF/YscJ
MFGKGKKKPAKSVHQKMVRPAKAVAPRSTREAKGAVEVTSDAFLSKLSPEAQAQLEANEKIMADVKKFVEEHPEEAGQLLRVWLKAAKEGE